MGLALLLAAVACQPKEQAQQIQVVKGATPQETYAGIDFEKIDWQTTESGLQYYFARRNENGARPEEGYLRTRLNVFLEVEDSMLTPETYQSRDISVFHQTKDEIKNGSMEEGVGLMNIGDSALFRVNTFTAYQQSLRSPVPSGVSNDGYVIFMLAMYENITEEQHSAMLMKTRYDMQLDYIFQNFTDSTSGAKAIYEQDQQTIANYLAQNNITTVDAPLGVKVEVVEEGNGNTVTLGHVVNVNYTGTLLNGTMFDTSIEENAKQGGVYNPQRTYGPLQYVAGQFRLIAGWEAGVMGHKVGSKINLYIPSGAAYGPRERSEVIQPNSILKFEIEIISSEVIPEGEIIPN